MAFFFFFCKTMGCVYFSIIVVAMAVITVAMTRIKTALSRTATAYRPCTPFFVLCSLLSPWFHILGQQKHVTLWRDFMTCIQKSLFSGAVHMNAASSHLPLCFPKAFRISYITKWAVHGGFQVLFCVLCSFYWLLSVTVRYQACFVSYTWKGESPILGIFPIQFLVPELVTVPPAVHFLHHLTLGYYHFHYPH